MSATTRSVLALAGVVFVASCGGDSGGDGAGTGPDAGNNATTTNNGDSCLDGLAQQCPPGSNPIIERSVTERCGASAEVEITDGQGSVTGICVENSGCRLVCNFTDPCTCGIDRIDRTGVYCVDCATASACGNALCEGGETVDSCPIDCAERCLADTERCSGNHRQECSETGLWEQVECRPDQACEFGASGDAVATICQTRITASGGSYPGLGDLGIPVTSASLDVRFVERDLQTSHGLSANRFVQGGERVAGFRDGVVVVVDPDGIEADRETGIRIDGSAWSPELVAIHARWPRVGDFVRDTDRTLDALVHDGAYVEIPQRYAITVDEGNRRVAAAFSLGYIADTRLPTVAVWDAATGEIETLLRFADNAVEAGASPASAVAFSPSGQVLAEGRPSGVVILWNVAERKQISIIQTEVGSVQRIAFAGTGGDRMLVGGTSSMALWSLAPSGELAPVRVWTQPIQVSGEITLAPDGSAVAYVDGPGRQTVLLDGATGEEVRTFDQAGPVHFDPRGGRLLAADIIYTSSL